MPLLENIIVEKQEENETKESQDKENIKNKAVSADDIKKWWQIFLESKEKKGSQLEITTLRLPVAFNAPHTIEITLSNSLQADILENMRVELIQFLRTKLQNDFIELKTVVKEQETKRKLYTSQEKFDYLKKENPYLDNLKKSLGLDFDF